MGKKIKCIDCGEEIELPEDCEVGEVIPCPSCGLEYEVIKNEKGEFDIKEFDVPESEDWGQ